jgi:hypothetical protein
MDVQVCPPLVDVSHPMMVPVYGLSVSVPLLLPAQTVGSEESVPVGPSITFTVTVVDDEQPPVVPVTVYIVVAVGYAITVAPVVIERLSAGLHVYDVAPLAVNVTLPPEQNAAGVGTVTVGEGLTVTVVLAEVAD